MTTLEVRDLVKTFGARHRTRAVRAVDGVSFSLARGGTTALVGESGSGKTTVARILARIEHETSGEIVVDGAAAPRLGRRLRRYRADVQMVFQDPFASLNPAHTVAYHLARPLTIHRGLHGAERHSALIELLERVSLTPAEQIAAKHPHELSGGQRQRVAIARALAPDPKLLLADEPVSMLDVSIRLELLNLIASIQRERDLAVLYITHDLATARYFSDTVLVMYRGWVVESGPSDEVILDPKHPYTQLLAEAAPDPGRTVPPKLEGRSAVEATPLVGCRFAPRCAHVMDRCRTQDPPVIPLGNTRTTRCWLYEGDADPEPG